MNFAGHDLTCLLQKYESKTKKELIEMKEKTCFVKILGEEDQQKTAAARVSDI